MSEKPKKVPKTPKRILRILGKMSRGESLVRMYRQRETGETVAVYALHPSGACVGPKLAAEVIATGKIIPNGDGLFGSETSQTWRAA
jgi:hypothetical protein